MLDKHGFTTFVGMATLALSLSACGKKDEAAAPQVDATVNSTTSGSVNREVVETAEPAPAPATPAALQTQPGPRGSTVSLNKVAVTGDILTVQMTYAGGESGISRISLDEVSLIDDTTAQRIGALKDNRGQWMAAPLNNGDKLWIDTGKTGTIVWIKFPAPPATSKTVSINMPEVAPFDGVPVTR